MENTKIPDTLGVNLDGFSGRTLFMSEQWVVRFFGDSAALDQLAQQPQATEHTRTPVQALNDTLPVGVELSESEWNNRMWVE